MTSRLERFDDIGSLRSTSAGILGIKGMGVFVVWQVVDEERNIRVLDASTVLRTDFYRIVPGDHIFSAISSNMVIHTQFESLKQCGFAVIAAAYDQRDTAWDPHTGQRTVVWKIQSDCHGIR